LLLKIRLHEDMAPGAHAKGLAGLITLKHLHLVGGDLVEWGDLHLLRADFPRLTPRHGNEEAHVDSTLCSAGCRRSRGGFTVWRRLARGERRATYSDQQVGRAGMKQAVHQQDYAGARTSTMKKAAWTGTVVIFCLEAVGASR
jgi:hypothetical protein